MNTSLSQCSPPAKLYTTTANFDQNLITVDINRLYLDTLEIRQILPISVEQKITLYKMVISALKCANEQNM